MTLEASTPLYKFHVVLRDRGRGLPSDPVVFARDAEEADAIAAALSGEPQQTGPTGVRTMHHPRLRGGLYEFTWGERLAEAHARLRSAARRHVFKFAGFSGPHPTLIVDCPTCGSPAGHYCNDERGRPDDGPHHERRVAAGTAQPTASSREVRRGD